MNKFECIMTIVDSGSSEIVVDAAKSAGAKGATIINARGSTNKPNKFFKLNIQPDKQIVMILTKEEETKAIVEAISKAAGMNTKSHALSFVLPVEDAIGMAEIFKKEEVSENLD